MPTASLVLTAFLAAAPVTTEIKVSQVGYPTDAPKLVLVAAATPAKVFSVRNAADGAIVLLGNLSDPVPDADSGDRVQTADLSSLSRSGTYVLEVPGVGRSFEFPIGPDVFARPLYLAMRSFYGQRCGTAVDLGPEFPGYRYPACHLDAAFHPSTGKTGPSTSAKGWHDAGDYGRYIVNSGITTGSLLWAYELFERRLAKLKLDIPESGNAVPDVLDEIRWNLDWMLSLQDEDGGVWHKQTSERFIGFVMPQDDRATSYVIGIGKEPYKSSCATADFAAAMAIAGRVYRPHDPAYAEKTLDAAKRAWTWVSAHPDVLFQNPEGVRDGRLRRPQLCGRAALGSRRAVAYHRQRPPSTATSSSTRPRNGPRSSPTSRPRGRTSHPWRSGHTRSRREATRPSRRPSGRTRWLLRTRSSHAPRRAAIGSAS